MTTRLTDEQIAEHATTSARWRKWAKGVEKLTGPGSAFDWTPGAFLDCCDAIDALLAEVRSARASSETRTPGAPRCTLPGCRCIEEAAVLAKAEAWWDARPKCRCGRPTWRDVSGVTGGGAEALRCVGPCGEVRDRCKCDPIDAGAAPPSARASGTGNDSKEG